MYNTGVVALLRLLLFEQHVAIMLLIVSDYNSDENGEKDAGGSKSSLCRMGTMRGTMGFQ